MMDLVSVKDVGQRHRDKAMVMPVREDVEDLQFGHQLVEIVRKQRTLVGVRVLDEEGIVAHFLVDEGCQWWYRERNHGDRDSGPDRNPQNIPRNRGPSVCPCLFLYIKFMLKPR